jgi:hypothetical protein
MPSATRVAGERRPTVGKSACDVALTFCFDAPAEFASFD